MDVQIALEVEYSTDLLEWKGEGEIVIEQVSEDLAQRYYRAYLETPGDCAFYRLMMRELQNTGSGSSSSGSSVGFGY